jgi:hypothetical protein
MKIRITKAAVIKAIREEPLLSQGYGWAMFRGDGVCWLTQTAARGAKAKDPDVPCGVCAVGAVLCSVLSSKGSDRNVNQLVGYNYIGCGPIEGYTSRDCWRRTPVERRQLRIQARLVVMNLLEAGRPLDSLSCIFETESNLSPRTARSRTVAFVREHFPSAIELEVGGIPLKGLYNKQIVRDAQQEGKDDG